MPEINSIKEILLSLNICNESSLENYHPRVRDRDDVSVMKCRESGVIFLSRTDHMDISYYNKKSKYKYHSVGDRLHAVNSGVADTERRINQFKGVIANKRWLEIGAGVGAVLDALSPYAAEVTTVEPQEISRKMLQELGYDVYSDVKKLPKSVFDVVTLFHVFEHFVSPIQELIEIESKMISGGKLIIEVPHANDFLLSFLENEEFKEFTLWAEHLILHTRYSLKRFIEEAGFININISGIQRFPLANHLYWLVKGKPGGHHKWDCLRNMNIDTAYSNLLGQLDMTDTLLAVAEKP